MTMKRNSALDDALALADVAIWTIEWTKRAAQMIKHCGPGEDVDQAATRVLAAEVRRLRLAIETTISENAHLADGDNCTLIVLKRALGIAQQPPRAQD